MQKTFFSEDGHHTYCPLCLSKEISKNGRYFVTGGTRESIQRYVCKKCGARFNGATDYIPYEPLSGRPMTKLKKLRKNHIVEKADIRREKLLKYIEAYGFPKIEGVKRELGMSINSYYRALRDLSDSQERAQRKSNKSFKTSKLLILEVKKSNRNTERKIKFYLLIDIESKKIIGTFLLKKRRAQLKQEYRHSEKFSFLNTPAFLYGEELSILDLYEKCVYAKSIVKDLQIEFSGNSRIYKSLKAKQPNLFSKFPTHLRKMKIVELKQSGFDKTISFTKTLTQVMPRELARNKNYDLEKRQRSTTGKSQLISSKDLFKTLRLLSFIHNFKASKS